MRRWFNYTRFKERRKRAGGLACNKRRKKGRSLDSDDDRPKRRYTKRLSVIPIEAPIPEAEKPESDDVPSTHAIESRTIAPSTMLPPPPLLNAIQYNTLPFNSFHCACCRIHGHLVDALPVALDLFPDLAVR